MFYHFFHYISCLDQSTIIPTEQATTIISISDSSTNIIPLSCCPVSNSPCQILQPCLNDGTCINTNLTHIGYECLCQSQFNGTQCQLDNRPCRLDTCWNNGTIVSFLLIINEVLLIILGTCYPSINTTFTCQCSAGWQGQHCENQINYCQNSQCLNGGVCRSVFLNYTCLCLGQSYSGRHCEFTSSRMILLQTVSKSFASIAIIAMLFAALFIITMDILKYCFNIDPLKKQMKRYRKKKKNRLKYPRTRRVPHVQSGPSSVSPKRTKPKIRIAKNIVTRKEMGRSNVI